MWLIQINKNIDADDFFECMVIYDSSNFSKTIKRGSFILGKYTVKRVDEVVRHPHLVTQDQFTQVSKKVSDIPEEICRG